MITYFQVQQNTHESVPRPHLFSLSIVVCTNAGAHVGAHVSAHVGAYSYSYFALKFQIHW